MANKSEQEMAATAASIYVATSMTYCAVGSPIHVLSPTIGGKMSERYPRGTDPRNIEIDSLQERLGEALVRENNLIAALEEIQSLVEGRYSVVLAVQSVVNRALATNEQFEFREIGEGATQVIALADEQEGDC
jgi:hypothetical protein